MQFQRNTEIADKEKEIPPIAKINSLMNQISTNLANSFCDTNTGSEEGIFVQYYCL